jgi:hypothetical protein
MRFLTRSLVGLLLLAVTLGLLGLAVATLRDAAALREAEADRRPPAAERIFAVNVGELERRAVSPVLTAYGDLRSAVQLELRAASGGTLLELAPGFRDGGRVRADDLLFRLDPAAFETELALAENALDDALAEEDEAEIGLELAREELVAAERQRDLRAQAQTRSQDLRDRGVGMAADLEAAELALSSAEQAVTGRRLALAQAEARVGRAAIAATRARIARDEAARNLADTVEYAPFGGMLAEVDAVRGRLVSANEKLALLIDPDMLEVAFRVSNAEFARLTDAAGELLPLEVSAGLEVDGIEIAVAGSIDRAGAQTAAGQTGRLIYARLDAGAPRLLRPGDFLTVRVSEPPLEDVAVVPATAVSAAGGILLLGQDDRLEEVTAQVLRRQGDEVVLGGVPFGRVYVAERLPQLGPGVKVRPVEPAEDPTAEGPPGEAAEMVRLTPERRAVLVAAVIDDAGMAPDVKERLLAALEAAEVPRQMVDRLETGGRDG